MDVLERTGSAGINGERINGSFHLLINDKVVVSNIFYFHRRLGEMIQFD